MALRPQTFNVLGVFSDFFSSLFSGIQKTATALLFLVISQAVGQNALAAYKMEFMDGSSKIITSYRIDKEKMVVHYEQNGAQYTITGENIINISPYVPSLDKEKVEDEAYPTTTNYGGDEDEVKRLFRKYDKSKRNKILEEKYSLSLGFPQNGIFTSRSIYGTETGNTLLGMLRFQTEKVKSVERPWLVLVVKMQNTSNCSMVSKGIFFFVGNRKIGSIERDTELSPGEESESSITISPKKFHASHEKLFYQIEGFFYRCK